MTQEIAPTTCRPNDVWNSRDLPVLTEVTKRIDAEGRYVNVATVAEAIGMPVEDVARSARALERTGMVSLLTSYGDLDDFEDVSVRAYIATGLYPDPDAVARQMVAALLDAAERATDPEETTKLRRLADAAGTVGGNVLAGVLATAGAGLLGLGN